MPPKRKAVCIDIVDSMGPCPMDIDEDNYNNSHSRAVPKRRKKAIPKAVKKKVWRKYFNEDAGSALCPVCKSCKIFQDDHHCAHIISEANGGATHEDNLIPTCSSCNLSMGTKSVPEFSKAFNPY